MHKRYLQVRTAQLDKEAAELRDETAHLEQVQNQMGSATAQGLKQQVRRRADRHIQICAGLNKCTLAMCK